MTNPLITQAESIIKAAIDDPTVPPAIVAWQAANAIVEAGWTSPPSVDVVEQAARTVTALCKETPWRKLTPLQIAQALADAGLLRPEPQQDAEQAARDFADAIPECPTCSGPIRETVGMVCQTCGTDYGERPVDD